MRYLIFAGPGIGDTVFELSLAKQLKKNDQDAFVALLQGGSGLSETPARTVFDCSRWADEFMSISDHSACGLVKTAVKLRKSKFDYSFSCTSSFKSSDKPLLFSKAIGCKSICPSHSFKKIRPRISVEVSESLNFVEQYRELGRVLFPEMSIDIQVLDKKLIDSCIPVEHDRPVVGICIGTNVTIYKDGNRTVRKNIKKWQMEKWVDLTTVLLDKNWNVCILGTETDLEGFDQSSFPTSSNNYIGKLTLRESLSVISQCNLVIGGDTGLMHCAAAFGIPTISLFGGTSERVWRPYSAGGEIVVSDCDCRPCYGDPRAIGCEGRTCMNRIEVSDVIEAVDRATARMSL